MTKKYSLYDVALHRVISWLDAICIYWIASYLQIWDLLAKSKEPIENTNADCLDKRMTDRHFTQFIITSKLVMKNYGTVHYSTHSLLYCAEWNEMRGWGQAMTKSVRTFSVFSTVEWKFKLPIITQITQISPSDARVFGVCHPGSKSRRQNSQ